ncbi:hypothetical protein GCM10017673_56680 [Streptosporangium violaceochromogenes]|nr:hypothetical protein GCM10017673_56680 [Streptosporangium violaceochromogenes]
MRQTLGFIAMWCGATVLAASVTWFGVRDVLRSQVFDDARIEPLSVALTGVEATPVLTVPPAVPGRPSVSPSPAVRPSTPRATPAASTRSAPRQRGIRPAPRVVGGPARSKGSVVVEPRPLPSATGATSGDAGTSEPGTAPAAGGRGH